MTDVTVIGLGLMGAALARTLVEANTPVTVWNRSPEKMQPLADLGAKAAATPAAAIAASPVVLICIDNYETTAALLGGAEVEPLLEGRTFIQFSSGSPMEVRQAAKTMQSAGAAYLDGKLLCGPSNIGTGSACIRLSGDRSAFEQTERYLRVLDPDARYLGENAAAAAAIDLAWLMTRYGNFIALAHAAKICESEQADLSGLLGVFPEGGAIHRNLSVIESGRYEEHSASLAVWGAALEHIREQGAEANIDTRIPDFFASYFHAAIAAGLGDQNVMALYKVIGARDDKPSSPAD